MKDLKLVLTKPCSEQWDDMEQAGTGRYCDRCEKNILDLTDKSDAELIRFFKNKPDNVCGRLLSSQLNRKLVLPPAKLGWTWLVPMAMGAIVVTPAQAQKLKPVRVQSDQNVTLVSSPVGQTVQLPLLADSISGRVVDEATGKPLKGVKLIRKGFENVLAITDSAGRFELDVKEGISVIPYIFELGGYSHLETSLSHDMVVKLTAQRIIMLGGISTIPVGHNPLYVVFAGKKSCTMEASRMSEISADWIESIEVLKDAKATAIYGSRAAYGVILINIKKDYINKIDFSKKK